MKKSILSTLLALGFASGAGAHDMFLKLESFFVPSGVDVSLALLNGTFEKSENAITRDRMADVRIVGPTDETEHPDAARWRDEADTAFLQLRAGAPGTYVAGVSTRPRTLELSAEEFNEYLEHDGALDVLAMRKRQGELGKAARERYSKHVKAVFQVGDARTRGYAHRLGYPAELVPLNNPYELRSRSALRVLFLKDGNPVPRHLVYASYAGSTTSDGASEHRETIQTRTDASGVAAVEIDRPGKWYVRTIHMEKSDEPDVDYVSNWATLSFEVR